MLNLPKARVYGTAATPAAAIAGRVRVVAQRFQTDAGWWAWRGVSDLAAMGYILSGREGEVWKRFDAYARARRTIVRVLGMLGAPPWQAAGLAFSPRTPGYADARARLVAEANRRGLYVEWCLFADAQIVVPDAGERRRWLEEFGRFCQGQPGIVPQLVNEAFQNGWQEADDEDLLELADVFAGIVGHRDFSISDPVDGDNPDASAETTARIIRTARHANIVVLHPDRRFAIGDKRWRRWVDHLEGMFDVTPGLGPNVAYVIDEPIGAAPAAIPGRRDNDPDAFIAAQFVAACCGFGLNYHKIDSEIAVEQLPGFYEAAAVLAQVPCAPEWQYRNDSWPGAPTAGIRWSGQEGKLRSLVAGDRAWTVAYGGTDADFASITWRPGWTPHLEYAGARVRVWSVHR